MIGKMIICYIALALVTLARGDKHDELLASGYEYFPEVGYYYFGSSKNWTFAQTDCVSTKGRLAVINSEEELQVIVSFLSNNTQDTYVFGGYTNYYESQYVTIEGVPLKKSAYTKWEAGKPSSTPYRCVGINTKTGELNDLSCASVMSYICEHQLWTDYNYVKELGYYKLHTDGKGWADAYAICESEGAHLLVIDSQAEADAVMQIYNEHPDLPNTDSNEWVYIGFRGVFEYQSNKTYYGTYLTIFDTSVSDLGYVKWYSDQPNNQYLVNCGMLYRESASYATTYCDGKLAFFCEKKSQVFNRA